MSSVRRGNNEQQAMFVRQATILRKNLYEWDRMLNNPRGEDWPTMVGRLNAALNQAKTLDQGIEDVLEHFVYLPKQSTANPQDIAFFLSTRISEGGTAAASAEVTESEIKMFADGGDPVQILARYEAKAAELATEFEENMVRF